MLSKSQMIDHIRQINRSAGTEWLSRFDPPALDRYLAHLQTTLEPRGRESRWIRHGETPAIVSRRARN